MRDVGAAEGSSEAVSVKNFVWLTFILSVPIWLLGGSKLPLPINLPASAVTAFVPALAAGILMYRQGRAAGLKRFVGTTWDFKKTKGKAWYLIAAFLPPAIYLASYLVMRVVGLPLPAAVNIPLSAAPAFFVMFYVTGAGEELGWSGYATEPLQRRWGTTRAALLLGLLWAIWHAITFVQTGNSAEWIVAQSLKTIAMRAVIVWIYNKTGKSVFASTLYHTTDNVSWSLFPNLTSHYNPAVTAALTALVALILNAVVTRRRK